ncbi:MAG: XdhC family protein [Pseudoxanthomonas sp.]
MKDDVTSSLQLADVHRAVMDASALADHAHAALALVVETEGSTYVRSGAMALFDGRGGQAGWLSGGCLEPEIEVRALAAARAGRLDWMDVDTRDDEDLLSGSALGCRGRLQLALLPLAALPGWDAAVQAWRSFDVQLILQPAGADRIALEFGPMRWELPCMPPPDALQCGVALLFKAPPQLVLFGAGPETPHLLPLLRDAGWMTTLVERRPRWSPSPERPLPADAWQALTPLAAAALPALAAADAALVMNHNFELDRETLEALAATDIPFIGLLGPHRRREDLFRVLPATASTALGKRLRSPVGLDLGGRGAQAIALSIAAQLQAWHHGRAA